MNKIPFPKMDGPGAYPYQTGTKISLILDRINKQMLLSLLPSFSLFCLLYSSVHSKHKVLWPYPKSAGLDGTLSVGLNEFWSRPGGRVWQYLYRGFSSTV